MTRVAIIGNAAGGKSTLAHKISAARGLPCIEVDKLLWQEGWKLAPTDIYEARHAAAIAADKWVIEGLGSQASIPARLSRANEIVLIDLPLWVHFALAAERQARWHHHDIRPAGMIEKPPTMALFRTMWEVDQNWLPTIRELCNQAGKSKRLTRLYSLEELDAYASQLERPEN